MKVDKELLGFTAGNFDLLHPGYIKCFKWAKKHCDKFIIFVNKNTKSIDILVNNVGAFVPGKLISEDDSALKLMIDTNLYSNYWVTRGLVKIFTNQKSGHIFNICSIASKVAYDSAGSYCISKFALYGICLLYTSPSPRDS